MKPIKIVVCGAGDRGTRHAENARACSDSVQVVGVAELRAFQRDQLSKRHGIPAANVFADWRDMARRDRFADAVIIATQDAMHVEPAEAFAAKGYHLLLEKPMAPDEDGCRRTIKALTAAQRIFAAERSRRENRTVMV